MSSPRLLFRRTFPCRLRCWLRFLTASGRGCSLKKCVFVRLWKSSSFNRFFPLAERQFSRDPPLILLKQRVTVLHPRVFEHLVIQPCPGNQTTTRTTDPHQTFCRSLSKVEHTHTHSTLHLDCVNRLQMISQKWNQGFGGVFSFVTSSPVSRDTNQISDAFLVVLVLNISAYFVRHP